MSTVLEKNPFSPSIVPTSDPTEVELSPPFGDVPSSPEDGPIKGYPQWAEGSIDYRNMTPIWGNNSSDSLCRTIPTGHSVHQYRRSYSPSHQLECTLVEPDPCQRDGPVSTPHSMQPGPSTGRPQSPATSNPPESIRLLPHSSFATGEPQTAAAERARQSLRRMRHNPSTRPPFDPTTTRTTPPSTVTLAPAERQHIRFQLELVDIEVAALLLKRRQLLALLSVSATYVSQ